MRSFLIASLFVLSAVVSAEDVGILLGLGSPSGTGSTIWISRQGVATFAQRAGQGYWLWRDDGFWHVLDEDRLRSGGRATVTVTDSSGGSTVFEAGESEPFNDYFVSFVSPGYLGLRFDRPHTGVPGYFSRNPDARESAYRNLRWVDLSTAVSVDSVFSDDVSAMFMKWVEATIRGPYAAIGYGASPERWTLTREKGEWWLAGEAFAPTGGSQDSLLATVTERSLGASNSNKLTWSQIRRKYPEAIDFTTSPDGELTVIITPNQTFVHKSNGRSLQKLLRSVLVTADRIVMTQWLEGDEVRKVGEAVTKIKS